MKRFITMIVSASDSLRLISNSKRILTSTLILIMALIANAQDYYLIGEFNGWNCAQDDCKFSAKPDGTYVLDFQGILTSDFKINDGTWDDPYMDFGGNGKLIPGQLYNLKLMGENIPMDVDIINPHLVFDPENLTLLLTGEESTIQKGKPQTMVTLSHNGELTFFTDLKAFESALEAAHNGDTIYLTEGDFYISQGQAIIDKRISIIGNGYGSYLSGNITIDMTSNPDSFMDAPLFDGVRLENVSFGTSDASVENMAKSEIRRCWINQLTDVGYAGKDVLLHSCLLNSVGFRKPNNVDTNVEIRNCKVLNAQYLYNCNMVLNCNVGNPIYYPETMISSIFDNSSCGVFGTKTPVVWNTLLYQPDSDVQSKDCYVNYWLSIDDNGNAVDYNNVLIGLSEFPGLDGTEVGAYGGDSPFSPNPSVPTVNTKRSKVEYDADINKLKVTIIVTED